MLINFSVENFRSIGGEQTLNLVASKGQKGHEDHCVPIAKTDERVLRTSVVYGANAAGKSNLVRAMEFAQDLIVHGPGPKQRIALSQFRFTDAAERPSSFEFRFLVGDQVFVYGFDVTPEEVVEEWLSATSENGRETDVFHRKGKEITFGNLKKFGQDGTTSADALKALELLGTRPNQLLLNKIVDLDDERRGTLLDRVVQWFAVRLTVIGPSSNFGPLLEHLDDDPDFKRFTAEFLANVGTGIGGIEIEQAEIDADKLPRELVESLESSEGGESSPFSIVGAGMTLSLHPDDSSKMIRRNLSAKHDVDGSSFSLPFDEESDGTRRFLHLLPALYYLTHSPKVFVIDELDRSLHSLLSHALLKFFVEVCPGANQQLIVTTHETHLLDLDLLRRDEIWFVEKDDRQQTRLFSLADLKVRKDLRIEKSYLQGRFGGVPFIGGADKLKDLVNCPTGL
ncbi:MAG: AAA family ATPase [Fuerstiella sp.]